MKKDAKPRKEERHFMCVRAHYKKGEYFKEKNSKHFFFQTHSVDVIELRKMGHSLRNVDCATHATLERNFLILKDKVESHVGFDQRV